MGFAVLSAAAGFPPAEAFWQWCSPNLHAAGKWETRSVGELTLVTPTPFDRGPDVRKELPEKVRDTFRAYEAQQAMDGPDFAVAIVRMAMTNGKRPNLDGAANGGMKQAIIALGDKDPQFEVTSTKVNGLEARRGSYHGKIRDDSWHVESLVITRGDTLWQIQVILRGDERLPDAMQVIRSVKVQ